MTVREYFKPFCEESELDPFCEWAFGEDYLELDDAMKYLECWNYHHGQDILLKPDGEIDKDAPRMVNLWKAKK